MYGEFYLETFCQLGETDILHGSLEWPRSNVFGMMILTKKRLFPFSWIYRCKPKIKQTACWCKALLFFLGNIITQKDVEQSTLDGENIIRNGSFGSHQVNNKVMTSHDIYVCQTAGKYV